MAIELLDEHEQGERVRRWLRDNGGSIIGGVALGVALIFGWQWWNRSQEEARVTAAIQYHALTEARGQDDAAAVAQLADSLRKEHPDSPYAFLAALQQADLALGAGDPDAAVQALQLARESAVDQAGVGLVALRMARARLAQGDPDAALKALDEAKADAWAGLVAEVRGDALLALGRTDEARAAYEQALQSLDVGAPSRSIVEMKLADAGGATVAEGA